MEWISENTHSSLFSQNVKFSFFQNYKELKGMEQGLKFNEIFIKTPKIYTLIYLALYFKTGAQ